MVCKIPLSDQMDKPKDEYAWNTYHAFVTEFADVWKPIEWQTYKGENIYFSILFV